MNIKSNLSIFGWPVGLFLLPMAWHGTWEERGREPDVDPFSGEREDVQDTWTTYEECFGCNRETEHLYLLFVDEQVAESECQRCKVLVAHEDRLGR